MSGTMFYSTGGPWGYGDSISLDNQQITQTLYLTRAATKFKVWFAGNGSSAYLVQSANLVQEGAITVPVKVNGKTVFYVPAFGRWSDYFSILSFTRPGYVNCVSIVKLAVPILIPITGGEQSGESSPGTVIGTNDGSVSYNSSLVFNFENGMGDDRNLVVPHPTYTKEVSLTSSGKFGKGLQFNPGSGYGFNYIQYNSCPITITDGITIHAWIYLDAPPSIKYPDTLNWYTRAVLFTFFASSSAPDFSVYIAERNNEFYLRLRYESGKVTEIPLTIADGEYHHFAICADSTITRFFIDGEIVWETDPPTVLNKSSWTFWASSAENQTMRMDAFEVIPVVLWTEEFTPPTSAPPMTVLDTISVTSTGTITVNDNSLIAAGDTITISGATIGTNTYTTPTGAANQIVIGPDASTTAANIAAVINDTYGAVFTATTTVVYGSDICTGGTATASSSYTTYTPDKAVDDNLATDWVTQTTLPQWWQYDLGSGVTKTVVCYTIQSGDITCGITDWTLQGSNNGSTWTTLDTQSGIAASIALQTYIVSNTTAYRYYRINITGGIDGFADIYEISMYEGSPAVSVTAYTSDTVTIADTSSGITSGTTTQSITYNTSQAAATLPSFTSYAEGDAFGDLGNIYGLSIIAPFTCSGTASQSGSAGVGYLPAFTGSGMCFLPSCTIDSPEADITALLKYQETWMADFAAMIVVPGDNDDAALVATQWVAANITYLSDLSGWGVADHWAEPRETLYWGQGDDEDGAFLLASILVNSGIPINKVRVYIGTLGGTAHKWVAYLRASDSKWVFLDWRNGSTYWNSISSLSEIPKAIDMVAQYDSASHYVTAYA